MSEIATVTKPFQLNEQQQAVMDWARDEQGSLNLIARAGCGKCLGKGTPVMKFNGDVVSVEDIQAGDLLMGPDSKPRQVIATNTGNGPLYKVTPTKGDSWVCNDVHVMTLVGSTHHTGEIIDVPLNEFMASCRTVTLSKEWKLFRVPISFEEQYTPYDAYLIGTWLGDGTVGEAAWTLGYDKEPILNYLKDLAPAMECRCKMTEDPRQNSWTVRYSVVDRNEKGSREHPFRQYIKSLSKEHIPVEYLKNSRGVRLALLAGLLDTDAHQSSPSTFDIVMKHFSFSEDFLFLCRSLGFAAYRSEKFVQLEGWDEPRLYYRVLRIWRR